MMHQIMQITEESLNSGHMMAETTRNGHLSI